VFEPPRRLGRKAAAATARARDPVPPAHQPAIPWPCGLKPARPKRELWQPNEWPHYRANVSRAVRGPRDCLVLTSGEESADDLERAERGFGDGHDRRKILDTVGTPRTRGASLAECCSHQARAAGRQGKKKKTEVRSSVYTARRAESHDLYVMKPDRPRDPRGHSRRQDQRRPARPATDAEPGEDRRNFHHRGFQKFFRRSRKRDLTTGSAEGRRPASGRSSVRTDHERGGRWLPPYVRLVEGDEPAFGESPLPWGR